MTSALIKRINMVHCILIPISSCLRGLWRRDWWSDAYCLSPLLDVHIHLLTQNARTDCVKHSRTRIRYIIVMVARNLLIDLLHHHEGPFWPHLLPFIVQLESSRSKTLINRIHSLVHRCSLFRIRNRSSLASLLCLSLFTLTENCRLLVVLKLR